MSKLRDLFQKITGKQTPEKGKPDKTITDFVIKVSCGVPGCIFFISQCIKISEKHTIDAVNKLYDNDIKGSDIYILYKMCCKGSVLNSLFVMEAATIDDIKEHIKTEKPYTKDEIEEYTNQAIKGYDVRETLALYDAINKVR